MTLFCAFYCGFLGSELQGGHYLAGGARQLRMMVQPGLLGRGQLKHADGPVDLHDQQGADPQDRVFRRLQGTDDRSKVLQQPGCHLGILREHQQWSVFWDPKYHLWRAAEDDPNSDLYAESPDAATIMRYITARS